MISIVKSVQGASIASKNMDSGMEYNEMRRGVSCIPCTQHSPLLTNKDVLYGTPTFMIGCWLH